MLTCCNVTLHAFIFELLEQSEYFFIAIAEWITTLKQPLQIKGNHLLTYHKIEIKQDVNVTELDGIV
jgi:hypothetical protein